ncbi:GumC family protein [Glaciecola siphonariae]|uniref:non-specific protein-tyrosine kinase n=1 Tax=Glaciecola siphonariae TaxID=521012 RepID=A0ABV9LYD5_9ALTE
MDFTPNKNTSEQFEQEQVLDIGQYWRTIKRAKWLIAFIALLCLSLGVYVASTATPIYQATSKILADPQAPSASREEQYVATALVFLFYETQYEIIQSRAIAETVVDKLSLVERYKEEQKQKAREPKSSFSMASIKRELSALLGNSQANAKPTPKTDDELKVMLATELQSNISVSGGKQSQVINISYQSPDPQLAAEIINAVAQAYIQFGLEARLGEVKNTEAWLAEQSSDLKAQLTESENKLRDFRMQQGIMDSDLQERDSNSRIQTLSNQLLNAQSNLSIKKELHDEVKDLPEGSKAFYSLTPVLENNTTSALVKEEARLQSRVNEFFQRYKEKHPKMIAARSELQSVQTSLNQEIAKIVDRIESDYRLAQQQVSNIQRLLTEERNSIQSLQGSSFTLTALEREVENNRRVYESFINRLMETNIKGDFTASNVQIIDSATVPQFPVKPNVKLIIALSLFVGLFLGVVTAFLREALHNTFRTPESIEENLNVPSLGMTIKLAKKEIGSIPELQYLQDLRSVFTESINTVRTSLMFSNIDNPPKTILVTSATGAEGKSTLAMNLAAAYGQMGKTLLLEVDLRKPSVAKNLNAPPRSGLTDVLAGSIELKEALLKPSEHSNYRVLTCGTIPHNPIELLSSDKFFDALNTFKKHFDHIILDGPPTLPVSDATVIGTKVDGVILAVRAEVTKIKASKEAVRRLQKLNANVIGAVLTLAEPQKISYYGDHYYAGEYYGTDDAKGVNKGAEAKPA